MADVTAPAPSHARTWLAAARPKTLPAAIAPVLVGVALAVEQGAFHALAAACALLGAVLIQVGTNYANDAEDFVRGADTEARKGPLRATAAGLVTPGQMRAAAAVAFALAFVAGLYLIVRGGWPILALGLASIASGVAYTAGRWALAYTGLADLFVLVFFGPVAVGGTFYVQALDLPLWVPIAGLGPGFLATAILLANNVRDVEEDRAADKRTLVVRFGRPAGVRLYNACISGAVVVPASLALVARDHLGVLAASALAALVGRRLVRTLATSSDPTVLNPLLGKTAGLLFVYSVVLAAGWVWT
ncbi:1,4-dihydroxy-2-naphthoate polyprenyltransferase [Rubrivirga sp.]|uniref:1,4-dihydroxy-2-naphthoate polyprenyltransferase n=1 Tax=Rubrivirga sp. TaxID=1885344 RepID=UPI003B51C40C